jgi:hypothetical protein
MSAATMSREDYLEDIEDLFDRQPDPIPREAALAIHGYVVGLFHSGAIELEDYKDLSDRLPLDGKDLAEVGVNL